LIDRHDSSYLLHQHCCVTSLRIIDFPYRSQISIGENCSVQSFTFGLRLPFIPMTLVTYKTKILYEATVKMLSLCSRFNDGLCHHPSLSNSGNVSGHYLAGSNKTSCWSSFVKLFINQILPSLPFALILLLVVSSIMV